MYTIPTFNKLRHLQTLFMFLLIIFIATLLSVILRTGCGHEFDPTTSARMGLVAGVDTTKPKFNAGVEPKPINHNFQLQGSDTLFRLLIFNITNPDDVTPNQKKQLLNWMNAIRQDTTSK